MKKIIAAALACLMMASLASCASANGGTTATDTGTAAGEQTNATNAGAIELNPVEKVFRPATSSATGAYATIKVSADIKFDDTSAWLGLCPAGKDYVTELEADEVDVIWFHADARENDTDPHVFACDFTDVEDGTYALVVTSSDDENVGYVIIQLEMTKKGDSLTFKYDNAAIKERPNK